MPTDWEKRVELAIDKAFAERTPEDFVAMPHYAIVAALTLLREFGELAARIADTHLDRCSGKSTACLIHVGDEIRAMIPARKE